MGALDSLWKANFAALEPYWQQVFNELGNTGSILPLVGLGDDGLPNSTSFKTRQSHTNGIEATFTWSSVPSLWDTPFISGVESNWQGIVPVLTFNGTDEEADSPDAAYWSRDDSSGEAWSVGAWLNIASTAAVNDIMSKSDVDGTEINEWRFLTDTSGLLSLFLTDDSVPISQKRASDAAVATGVWIFVVATYDGAGGATAANTITLYVDGASVASTATNQGTYVAMENGAARLSLGMRWGTTTSVSFFNGKMAGGPFGPFFTQVELTAAQVKNLYTLGRAAMGLK